MADIIRGLMVLCKGIAVIVVIGLGLWLLYVGVFVGIPWLFMNGIVKCYDAYQDHAGTIWLVILIVVVLLIAKAVGKASRG